MSVGQVADMPKPWPAVVGFDGMSRRHAGVAMKIDDDGQWVPVEAFDPPFPDDEQAALSRAAHEAYVDRCAEYAVKGAVA